MVHDIVVLCQPIGGNGYSYSSENLLLSGPSGAVLVYDPLARLYRTSGAALPATRFLYDGQAMIGEYDTAGVLQRRYVFGPGGDEPLLWYEGSGTTDRRWLHADERGSIVATSDASGGKLSIGSYDEYGVPGSANSGRFGYTGQAWLREVGLWYYKARMYAPGLGRFLQTDPVGYGDGLNWYGYVGGDPVNWTDPSGLREADVVVTGSYDCPVGTHHERNRGNERGCVPDARGFIPRITDLFGGSSVGHAPGGASPAPQSVGCTTRLPDGKTIGDYVRDARASMQAANTRAIDPIGGGGASREIALYSTFVSIVQGHGLVDFKNIFVGKASRDFLGDAGNFAYYAIGEGYISNNTLDLGAGAYGLLNAAGGRFPFSFLTGRFFSNDSARRMRTPGLSAGGC